MHSLIQTSAPSQNALRQKLLLIKGSCEPTREYKNFNAININLPTLINHLPSNNCPFWSKKNQRSPQAIIAFVFQIIHVSFYCKGSAAIFFQDIFSIGLISRHFN